MLIVDIRNLLDASLSGPELPQFKFKVQKLTEIIAARQRGWRLLMSCLMLEGTENLLW
jgi:hypothetical protein